MDNLVARAERIVAAELRRIRAERIMAEDALHAYTERLAVRTVGLPGDPWPERLPGAPA